MLLHTLYIRNAAIFYKIFDWAPAGPSYPGHSQFSMLHAEKPQLLQSCITCMPSVLGLII